MTANEEIMLLVPVGAIKVQLAAARAVSGATRGTSHQLLYDKLRWNKLEERGRIHRLKLYHKMIHDKSIPQTLRGLPPEKKSTRTPYSLRNDESRTHLKASSTIFLNSFIPETMTRDWNQIPEEI